MDMLIAGCLGTSSKHQVQVSIRAYVRRPVQPRKNPLEELDDDAFYARFRFTKAGARYIFSLIEDKFVVPRKQTNNFIPPICKLLAVLRFYATESSHMTAGDLLGILTEVLSAK